MPVTTGHSPGRSSRGTALRHDRTRREQLALLAEIRKVEHWRRLVAARLDLAVAAVAAVDEPAVRSLAPAPVPRSGLRELLGLTAPGAADEGVALLVRLREAQRDLDAYARALRAQTREATAGIVSRLDDRRPVEQAAPGTALAAVLPLRRSGRRPGDPDEVA